LTRARSVSTRAYDTYAAVYAARLDPTLAAAAARVAELTDARPGTRVLDVATGTGSAAQAVAGRGASVVAIDSSPGMLDVARRLAPELDFRRCDAHALPFSDASFDAATCGLSLSHFGGRETALREILRVCAPGRALRRLGLGRRQSLSHRHHRRAARPLWRSVPLERGTG
jgi:ubiquinone/menaquinone biosynthesis C-methylase UbiE